MRRTAGKQVPPLRPFEKLAAAAEFLRADAGEREASSETSTPTWAREAADANEALKQLLAATDRNLALLRRLRGAAERPQAWDIARAGEAIDYGEKIQRSIGRGSSGGADGSLSRLQSSTMIAQTASTQLSASATQHQALLSVIATLEKGSLFDYTH